MADVLGHDISERRADLRAWLTDSDRKGSVLPPAESSGDLGAAKGAMVSVYVPPLFDMGTLRGAAEGSQSAVAREARLQERGASLAAIAVVGVVGVVRVWHRPGQAVTTTAAPSPPAPVDDVPAPSHCRDGRGGGRYRTAAGRGSVKPSASPEPPPPRCRCRSPPAHPPVVAVAQTGAHSGRAGSRARGRLDAEARGLGPVRTCSTTRIAEATPPDLLHPHIRARCAVGVTPFHRRNALWNAGAWANPRRLAISLMLRSGSRR